MLLGIRGLLSFNPQGPLIMIAAVKQPLKLFLALDEEFYLLFIYKGPIVTDALCRR